MMKKLGFLSLMSAALLLVSCNNLGNDPDINGNGGGNDEPQFVEPAGDGTEANPYTVEDVIKYLIDCEWIPDVEYTVLYAK